MNIGNDNPLTILAIDPGRAKFGVAVLRYGSAPVVHHKAVCDYKRIDSELKILAINYCPDYIVIGDGTGSAEYAKAASQLFPDATIEIVDEKFTSQEAKKRVLINENPRGFRKLIPLMFRDPLGPIDDEVAVILAERKFVALNEAP